MLNPVHGQSPKPPADRSVLLSLSPTWRFHETEQREKTDRGGVSRNWCRCRELRAEDPVPASPIIPMVGLYGVEPVGDWLFLQDGVHRGSASAESWGDAGDICRVSGSHLCKPVAGDGCGRLNDTDDTARALMRVSDRRPSRIQPPSLRTLRLCSQSAAAAAAGKASLAGADRLQVVTPSLLCHGNSLISDGARWPDWRSSSGTWHGQ
jgi:hypothetical protein